MVTNSKLLEINVSSSVWEGIMIQVHRKVTKSLIDMVWNFPKSYCLTRQQEDMSKILCHFRYDAAFPENFVTPIVMQLNLDAVQFLNWTGYLQYPVYFHRKWNLGYIIVEHLMWKMKMVPRKNDFPTQFSFWGESVCCNFCGEQIS